MDTTNGNKLIAEFMGVKIHPTWNTDLYNDENLPVEISKYHTSWDWLMPVVEKISRIKIIAEYSDTFYPRTFGMLSGSGKPMVRINACPLWEASTLIEATYLAVVDFIEWYATTTNKETELQPN